MSALCLGRGHAAAPTAPWLVEELGVRDSQAACDLIRKTLKKLDWSQVHPKEPARGWIHNSTLRAAFGGKWQPEKLADRRKKNAHLYLRISLGAGKREKKARELLADTLARIAATHRQ